MADINGTPGDDGLAGTTGDDTINAYAGDDVVNGREGNDTIYGDDGHDLLNAQQGNDTIYGGTGDDLTRPGTGDDYADGGSGYDRVSYASVGTDNLSTGVSVSLELQGTWQDTGGGGVDYLVGFEHLTGTRYDDTLTGDNGDNWLWGGFDPATGIAGNDTISGGGGNDLVQIGLGNAIVDGGAGTDALTFLGDDVGVPTGITFDLSLQGTSQATSFGDVHATNFENLSGTIFDDNLSGDGGANVLAGDRGDDHLSGGAGDDTLYGDGEINVDTHNLGYSGPITLIGDLFAGARSTDPSVRPGNDVLDGGRGDDFLYGGGGDDVMTGGQGHDHFVIEWLSNRDTITDFSNQDTIVFDAPGVDAFSDLTVVAVGNDTLVTWGTSDSLLLQGVKPNQLSASDFSFGGAAAAALLPHHDASPHAADHFFF
jgi:Ca2+-binding RTX toxin-like protein